MTAKAGQGRMDTLITGIVNATVVPMGDVIGWMASSGVLLLIFGALWVGFGAAIVASQGSLDAAWHWLRELPIIPQAVLWLLFLPVAAGLWVWEQAWPFVVRLVVVAGIAGWNILVFLPSRTPVP